MLRTCFVIQCFDGSIYDKRYHETFAPAIEKGGAKAIRADEVLGTRPVVEKIEAGLQTADVAFAEVSEDNPNVFLELGYALALNVPTVIVCDRAKRDKLPFDIAHRPINFYSTEAQSDYESAARMVQSSIAAAIMERRSSNAAVATSTTSSDQQVDDVKGACLIALLDQDLRSPAGASLWEIQKEVATAGVSERMVALAVASLIDDQLVRKNEMEGDHGELYATFSLTEAGTKYLLRSYSSLIQQERDRLSAKSGFGASGFGDDLDDNVPF